jgi:hypothetical protein
MAAIIRFLIAVGKGTVVHGDEKTISGGIYARSSRISMRRKDSM